MRCYRVPCFTASLFMFRYCVVIELYRQSLTHNETHTHIQIHTSRFLSVLKILTTATIIIRAPRTKHVYTQSHMSHTVNSHVFDRSTKTQPMKPYTYFIGRASPAIWLYGSVVFPDPDLLSVEQHWSAIITITQCRNDVEKVVPSTPHGEILTFILNHYLYGQVN